MTLSQTDRLHATLWIAAGIAALALLYALSGILTPFLLAGILAYIANPAVDRLARLGMPRTGAVLAALIALALLFAGLALIIFPLLFEELGMLTARTPEAVAQINQHFLPWLERTFGIRLRLDPAALQKFAAGNLDLVQTVLQHLYDSAKIGGSALLSVVVNLLLVPVVMFYLLLDWHALLQRVTHLVPLPWQGRLGTLAQDIDAVLTQYLRGQMLVMALLAMYYSAALWLAGIPSAFSLGLVSGMLIFIPYLGFATGFGLALLVAGLQFAGWTPVIAVLVVYGLGQMLESFLLTPYLVGERIGLHPLAVIFALMAFGQVFGFFGVLLALPAAAALAVALREVRTAYLASRFYQGQP
ncbi:MAG: AI-2E family transporter [Rugosibacter sp.]|nr:AI-2E family transporter [Rugosibacter sp.]